MADLKDFQGGPGLPGTMTELIYALKQRYGTTKPYVTVESASNKILSVLSSGYKVVSASYQGATEDGEPTLSTLIVKDDRLDAFFVGIPGFTPTVIIFFSDLAEVQKLRSADVMNVPFGSYALMETMQGYVLAPITISATDRPILEPGIMEALVSDTDTFFASSDFYRENKIDHKRGILVIGAPGTGKTTLTRYYLSRMKDKFGIVIDCSTAYFSIGMSQYFRAMFSKKPKVLVLEDVDGVTSGYGSGRSAFLNFIDGPNELSNTLILATTNYPERLDPAILDRPSRFDAIYYVGLPGPELRKEFLLKWFPELSADESRLSSLADATEGFTGAYYKELFTLCGLRKCTVEEALEILSKRKELLQSLSTGDSNMALYNMNQGDGKQEAPRSFHASSLLDYQIDAKFAQKLMGSKCVR